MCQSGKCWEICFLIKTHSTAGNFLHTPSAHSFLRFYAPNALSLAHFCHSIAIHDWSYFSNSDKRKMASERTRKRVQKIFVTTLIPHFVHAKQKRGINERVKRTGKRNFYVTPWSFFAFGIQWLSVLYVLVEFHVAYSFRFAVFYFLWSFVYFISSHSTHILSDKSAGFVVLGMKFDNCMHCVHVRI